MSSTGIRRIPVVIALAAIASLLAIGPSLAATAVTLSSAANGAYSDGATFGSWQVVFGGYGPVTVSGTSKTRTVTLDPMSATTPDETHAALVVSQQSFGTSTQAKMRVTTVEQSRLGSAPNPWETGWVVFNYGDTEHFYYLALKTNGWELGKRDPAYPGGQRFLATGSTPKATVGTGQSVIIKTSGATMTVTVDGKRLTTFTDKERAYTSGRVGFYTEDAKVTFTQVNVTAL